MSRYEYSYASTFDDAGFYLPKTKLCPDQDTFTAMSGDYDYVPIYIQNKLNNFDIVSFYNLIDFDKPCCMLESLSGSDNGRYSIIAADPLHDISTTFTDPQGNISLQNFISSLRVPTLDFPFFSGGLIGYWSYETGMFYRQLAADYKDLEEQYFFMPKKIIVYDRHTGILTIVIWIKTSADAAPAYEKACRELEDILASASHFAGLDTVVKQQGLSWTESMEEEFSVNVDRESFSAMVKQAQEHIRQGDIFQVVLSRRWKKRSTADPWQVYIKMRRMNPSPYMFYFNLPQFTLMGASPEMQVKVQNKRLRSRPIAGTRKVTGDIQVDSNMEKELQQDEKELSEHLMLVDLCRNDVGSVSKPGSVQLQEYMQVEKYSHVMHLVSTVEGELKPGISSLEAFQACFPAGTLSGAPKRKAMEIIKGLENSPRGPYGGAVGYVSFNGLLDSCISIRAILHKKGTYYLQSGAGIVADSDPELECKETLNKARVLMLAVKEAEELP